MGIWGLPFVFANRFKRFHSQTGNFSSSSIMSLYQWFYTTCSRPWPWLWPLVGKILCHFSRFYFQMSSFFLPIKISAIRDSIASSEASLPVITVLWWPCSLAASFSEPLNLLVSFQKMSFHFFKCHSQLLSSWVLFTLAAPNLMNLFGLRPPIS